MPGPPPSAPLGTVSSYKRALRKGQKPTPACKAAWAKYHRERYRRIKAEKVKSLPETGPA